MEKINATRINELVNGISDLARMNCPVEDVAKVIRLYLAGTLVTTLPRPQNDSSADIFFNFELKNSVLKSLDVINEVYPFNIDVVMALTRSMYLAINQQADNMHQAIFISSGAGLCGIPKDYQEAANLLISRNSPVSTVKLPFADLSNDD